MPAGYKPNYSNLIRHALITRVSHNCVLNKKMRENKPIKRKSTVFMVGAFPPPVHGMAIVNIAMRDRLHFIGVLPKIFDITITSLNRTLWGRLGRLPKALKELFRFILTKRMYKQGLYISISGGCGKVYEALFILLGRLRKMRLFLHHHSSSYLIKKSILAQILITISGKNAIHLTQSLGLSKNLKSRYKCAKKVIAISNTAIVLDPLNSIKKKKEMHTIGFLSNLSKEKGVFEFLDTVELLQKKGIKIKALLAGPFQDNKMKCLVLSKIDQLSNIEYIGPVYGHNKEIFFSSIDVFIFPTRYKNETEGIVNHEAMRYSVPVIAYGRGAIPEIIDNRCGFIIDVNKPFVPCATSKLVEWFESPEIFRKISCGARNRFYINYIESRKSLIWLINNLCANGYS